MKEKKLHFELDSTWPKATRVLYADLLKKYGSPSVVGPENVTWYWNGPWKRTVLYREAVRHNFPTPHFDVLKQTINYLVPLEMCESLLRFDGSLLIHRVRGELSAFSASEEMNYVSLNLAHDIVTGVLTTEQARKKFGELAVPLRMNWPVTYSTSLQFNIARGDENVRFEMTDSDTSIGIARRLKGVLAGSR